MNGPVLLRDVLRPRCEPPFASLLNLWDIEGDALVGVDLQTTRVFRLTCPDALFMTEAELEQHGTAIGRLLDSLPVGATVQLLVRAHWDAARLLDERAPRNSSSDMLSLATEERAAFLKLGRYKRVEHYLAVTTHAPEPELSPVRALSLCVPNRVKDLEARHDQRVQELDKTCSAVVSCLRDAKVSATPLSADELSSLLYERLNPAAANITEPPRTRKGATLRSQLALNACEDGFDTLTLDGHHHRALNLQVRPTTLDGRAMHLLLDQLSGDFDFVVAVRALNQEKAERDLRSAATAAFTLANVHVARYHEAALKTEDCDALAEHAKSSFQKLYSATCHVVLRATDREALTREADAALQAFRRLDDAVAVVDDMNHLPLFLASLPGHAHLNPRAHVFHTEAAARLLTMSASWDGSAAGQVVLPCDDGKLLPLDLFSEELTAKHSLILGVSGEGKSVLTNTLLTGFYGASEDNHVVVIDDGGSYRRLCELLGGQYLEPTLNGAYAFNPMLPREHAFDKAGRLDADFLSFVTLLIQLMVRKADLTNNEKSIVQKCLVAAYAGSDGTPLLGDLRAAFGRFKGDAQDVAVARDLYKNLEIWADGTYGRLLNRASDFDASARFLVFDLNKMTQEDLKPVVLLIIKSVIHPKLADKRLRKIIALDEVWKFLREKAGADLVTEWYKTGRRFNAAVSVITQSAEDLLKSAAAAAIAENSTVKWVLNLGGGYERLRELKLGDEEIAAIKALGKNEERRLYRKVFLRFGDRKRVVRNVLSPAAYWLYTSDPQDLRCEQALKAKEPGWPTVRVIQALAAMRDAHPEWRADDYLREIAAGRY